MKRILFIAALFLTSVSAFAQPKSRTTDYHQTAVTKFIEVDGTRYAYRVLGKEEGIPLILLQGSLFSMDEWDPSVTNGLAQQHRVILFDNKGVSSTNGKTPDTISEMAQDAISFIKALGYAKVNLLGLSMGGMITQQILLTEPQLVNKFILVGTGPKGSEGLANLGNTLSKVSNLGPPEQLLYLLFTPSVQSKELGKLALTRMNKRTVDRDPATTNETNVSQITAVLGWALPNPDALEQLKTITQPALIIEGRYDLLVPVVNSFNLYQNLPNAKLSLYPDAAHGSIFQLPDLFLADAVPFLKSK